MKKIYTLFICALVGLNSIGQTANLGNPVSWNLKGIQIKNADVHTMPGFDLSLVEAEDEINDALKDKPWRFGYKYSSNFNLENSGVWTSLPNGNRIWKIEIIAQDAITMNLIFENFYLPNGAHLYLYDKEKTNKVGAYTSRNNNSEMILGTELVHGEHLVVEYFEPASVAGQGHFTIANVVHGYRTLTAVQKDLTKAFESSGNCNVDVNCPLGTGWEDQIHSVAMIVVSGNGICTGALINNTCDDGTPYFLTADHCVGGSTASWAFRFNWESPPGTEICAAVGTSVNPGPPYDQTMNGATTLYTSAGSDVALLQITNMTLTDAQNWGCFYAGWDNTDALTVTQATGVHHPSGDLKKICRENQAPTHNTAAGAQVWWIADWDNGVTEPGSSGSPLFDQNGRIIGQLYGGLAACSGTNDNGQYDYYGRFGVSWPGLAPFLAPGACGTATTNDGFNPNQPTLADDSGISGIASPTGNYCDNNFDPVVTLKNYGSNTLTSATINYDIDGGTNNTFSWTGTLASGASVSVALPNMTTAAGAHTFNAYTTLPNGVADSNPLNDDWLSGYTATIGGQAVTLTINTDCWGYETAWQIVDVGMSVVEEGGNLSIIPGGGQSGGAGDPGAYGSQATIVENFCLALGCYDLIIYDDYGDGLDGVSSGCAVDGDYSLTDASMNVLASLQTVNFGDSETTNFCLNPPCAGSVSSSSSALLCNADCNSTITINATGGTLPYTYDIGSGAQASNIFTGMCAGNYTVVVEDGDNCAQNVSVTITQPAAISGSTVITNELLGNDGAINLTAGGGTGTLTYAWTGPSGFTASTEDITGLTEGVYSVTITDANGCTTTINNIQVTSSVDINEVPQFEISVYPNPSSGVFTIQLDGFSNESLAIEIFDVSGRVVFSYSVTTDTKFQLDLSSFAKGTYQLQLVAGENKIVKRIVLL